MAQNAGTVLAGLNSARTPWLALAMAGSAGHGRLVPAPGEVTVIDIADPGTVPVTVNPLEPGPRYPVQAHADRLAGLLEAAFGLVDPVAGALRAGLRRAYADCGWDMLTGTAGPGAAGSAAVPSFRQLKLAVLAAAGELGYGASMRAGVRGFLEARLDALWGGPAGRFLEGGHPVDLARLLRGNVLVANSGVADDEGRTFLAGVLLLRLAEQLSHGAGIRRARGGHANGEANGRRTEREGPRLAIVIASASPDGLGVPPRAAAWFSRLQGDVRLAGADIIVAPLTGGVPPGAPRAPATAPSLLAGPGAGQWMARWMAQSVAQWRRRPAGRPRCQCCCPGADRRRAANGAGGARVTDSNCTRPDCWPTITVRPGSGSGYRRWYWPSSPAGQRPGCRSRCDRAGRRSARAAASACWRP